MLDWKKQPRFYLNPTTGRLIKSTGRVYTKLKKDSILMLRDKCLYNPKSAQRCLTKLLTLYPNVYPPSNFIKIPKTHKRVSIRAFIKDPRKKYLVGYINKFGKPFRLRRPIITKKKVPIVFDYHNVLHKIITNKNCITENTQKRVEKQIKAGILLNTIENTIILFNPIQNDFIPINKTINQDEIKSVIKMINNKLIPHELQPITLNLNISAIIIEDNKIIGFVDKYNQLKRFTTPIKIISKRKYIPLKELTEEETTEEEETTGPETITEPEITEEVEEITETITEPEITEKITEEITEEETTGPETITEPEITEEVEEITETITEPEITEEITEEEITETITEPEITEEEEEIPEEIPEEETAGPEEITEEEITETIPEEITEEEITETIPEEITEEEETTGPEEITEEEETTEEEEIPEEITEEEITEEEETTGPEEITEEETTEPETTEEEITEEEVPEEITKTLPSVTTIKGDDYIDLKEELEKAQEVEPKEIAEKIRCLEGEQFDVNEQRCLPCTHYGLVWDSQYKLCKQMLKEDIIEQKDDNIDIKTDKLKILFDTNDNIIGFLDDK